MTKRFSLTIVSVFSILAAIFATMIGWTPIANAQSYVKPADLKSGDLIRGQSFSSVYYFGKDEMRYVFPNDKTYFTWYSNFDNVKWLTDADLATIQIGGNATYKPGVKMIKINSDPKVYAVGGGGTLRHVSTEAIAIALYGNNWNKMIDDVPDGFFPNYKISGALESAGSFSVNAEKNEAKDIDTDKGIKVPVVVTITDNAYTPSSITVSAGQAVKFINKGSAKHTASSEDGSWGTGTMQAGASFIKYFKKAGSFPFHCTNHSSMTGMITVQ
ncbi:cupredoxin domain-containing protein [Candidatus Uhrbacteria bacterium]|nr:cupredoxin domain-containing protein [Candidatus Uhrbacteria bacterium]